MDGGIGMGYNVVLVSVRLLELEVTSQLNTVIVRSPFSSFARRVSAIYYPLILL